MFRWTISVQSSAALIFSVKFYSKTTCVLHQPASTTTTHLHSVQVYSELWLVQLFVFFLVCLFPSVHPEEEKKKKVVRLPVQRSVETGLAVEFKSRFTRQLSRDPDAEDPKPGAWEWLQSLFSLLFMLKLNWKEERRFSVLRGIFIFIVTNNIFNTF